MPPTREPAHVRWRPTVSAAPTEPAAIPTIRPSSEPVPEALEPSMLALRLRVAPAMVRLRGNRVVLLRLSVSVIDLGLRGMVLVRLLVLVRSWTAVVGLRCTMMGLVCLIVLRSVAAGLAVGARFAVRLVVVILMLIVVSMLLLLATIGLARPSVVRIYVVPTVLGLLVVGLIVAWSAAPRRVLPWLIAAWLRMSVVDVVVGLAMSVSSGEARTGVTVASTWPVSRCRRRACMSFVRLGMWSNGVHVWSSVTSPGVSPSVMRRARARFGTG